MKIITISREFGSGGRELGKRLADALGIPCYDHEIIDMVAEKHGFDKNYVAHVSEKDLRIFYQSTIGHRFMMPRPAVQQPVKVAVAEHEIIRHLAEQGDCVIVGRCAEVVCRDMDPFNIFVYADRVSKLQRCEERADEKEHFSEKEMLRKMRQIDKERAAYHELFADEEWGRKEFYHLCINTSVQAITLNTIRSIVLNSLVITLLPKIFGSVVVWHTFGIYEVLVLIVALTLKKVSERNGIDYR